MIPGVGIWISAGSLNESEDCMDMRWTIRRLEQVLSAQGLEAVLFLDTGALDVTREGVRVDGFTGIDTFVPRARPLDALLYRGGPIELDRGGGLQALRSVEAAGLALVNSSECFRLTSSQCLLLRTLEGVVTAPRFRYAETPRGVEDALGELGPPHPDRPYVVKLDRVGGQGFVGGFDLSYFLLSEWNEEARWRLRRYLVCARKLTGGGVLLQDFVVPLYDDEGRARDLKLYVAGGRLIGARQTHSAPGAWLTSYRASRRTSGVRLSDVPEKVLEEARHVAAQLNLDFGTIDFFLGHAGHVFLEVNANPSDLLMLYNVTGIDPVVHLAEALRERLAPGKPGGGPEGTQETP